jgi:membrane-bound serine protease (ClpP class)
MKIPKIGFYLFLLLALSLLLPRQTARGQDAAPEVIVMDVTGPVAPAMKLYIERGLQYADQRKAALVVMQLNTPGGSVTTLIEIISLIRTSPVPVAVYITPRGAMAASAGTLITLAGHASAMAPETMIGAASPVGSQGEDIDTTMETKVKEVLKASARELMLERSPEAIHLAENMIDKAQAVSSSEAVKIGLVDFQVSSLDELLAKLDGRKVKVLGQEQTLRLAGASQETVPQSLIELALQYLTDPNLVFLFLSAGIWAIIIEISSPGGWIAGFTGAVLLLLATFGLGILPVNWFGLLFLGLAFLLFILDIKAPTHGALTVAGSVSFIAGALVLFNSVRVPGIPTISIPLVIGTGLFLAASFFAILTLALRAQTAPVLTGRQTLIGRVGVVKQAIGPKGKIQVGGELWTARLAEGEAPIPLDERAQVLALDGLQLIVKKADPEP